jgi:8-oxo-dGTP pyrophosphatase MutT (NUDIX family)
MDTSVRSIVAGIVLMRPDRSVLLQLRDNKPGLSAAGLWVFPGGHCEPCESLINCARREFQEETGYDCVDPMELVSLDHRSPDTGKEFRLNFYWALYDGVQEVRCFEGQRVAFVAREQAAEHPMPTYLFGVWDLAIKAMERKQG